MPHVFISYVREDRKVVDRLYKDLCHHGINIWLDRTKIRPGQRWRQAIRSGIEGGAFFLACFSDKYTARCRSYMNEEVTLAIDVLRQRPTDRIWFIPVLLSDCEVPDRDIGGGDSLRDLQWVNLSDNWHAGVQKIVEVIKGEHDFSDTTNAKSIFDSGKHRTFKRLDGEWTMNLGGGFAIYLNFSGNCNFELSKYKKVVQLVAKPCQELGLGISIPTAESYSTNEAIDLGDAIVVELRRRNPQLASVFEFVWRVMLLLLVTIDAPDPRDQERKLLERTLSNIAKNADMLDSYCEEIIQTLSWKKLTPEHKKDMQDAFIAWAHKTVLV